MNMIELKLNKLQEKNDLIKKQIEFVNSEIERLNEVLKNGLFGNIDFETSEVLFGWDRNLKTITAAHKGNERTSWKSLSVKDRLYFYDYIQEFIDFLIEEELAFKNFIPSEGKEYFEELKFKE